MAKPEHPRARHLKGSRERKAGRLTAGYVKYLAMNGGDPQVRGACIKDDREALRGSSNADLTIVLGLRKK